MCVIAANTRAMRAALNRLFDEVLPQATTKFKLLGLQYDLKKFSCPSISMDALRKYRTRTSRIAVASTKQSRREALLRSFAMPIMTWAGPFAVTSNHVNTLASNGAKVTMATARGSDRRKGGTVSEDISGESDQKVGDECVHTCCIVCYVFALNHYALKHMSYTKSF